MIHLKEFKATDAKASVLLIHGSIENGRIFYSKSHKGFAPFLAKNGFNVFVADLRGRGESYPPVKDANDFSLDDQITNDIPKMIEFIKERYRLKILIACHSFGGVLANASLIRYPHFINDVKGLVYFASRRRITILTFDQFIKVGIIWNILSRVLLKIKGYLPGKLVGIGSDDEPKSVLMETIKWVKNKSWLAADNFDYRKQDVMLPPVLQIAGIKDKTFAHPRHIAMFMNDFNAKSKETKYLSKKNGNLQDYNHISILTSPNAVNDHFIDVIKFFEACLEK